MNETALKILRSCRKFRNPPSLTCNRATVGTMVITRTVVLPGIRRRFYANIVRRTVMYGPDVLFYYYNERDADCN